MVYADHQRVQGHTQNNGYYCHTHDYDEEESSMVRGRGFEHLS